MKSVILIFAILAALHCPMAEARKKAKRSNSPAKPAAQRVLAGEGTLEHLLKIEDLRLSKDPFLLASLRSPYARIARQAFITLGRIGDPSGLEEIKRVLDRRKGDKEVKRAAAFALGLINDPTAVKLAAQNVSLQKDPDVAADLLLSVGRQGNEKNLETIASMLKDDLDPKVREAAAHALGLLWSVGSEKWPVPSGTLGRLVKMLSEKESVALAAAFALARFKGDPTLYPMDEMLAAAGKLSSPQVRALLCRSFGKAKTIAVAQFLIQQAQSEGPSGVRAEAIKSLGAHPLSEPVVAMFKKGLTDSSTSVQWQTLETIGLHGIAIAPLGEAVDNLYRNSPSFWVKGAAIKCLAKIQATLGRQRTNEVLSAPNSPLLAPAVGALGILGTTADIERMAKYIVYDDIKVAAEALEALSSLTEDRVPEVAKAGIRKAIERIDTALTSLAAQIVEKFKWKEFAAPLATAYPLFTVADQLEAKVALLNALGVVGDNSHVPVLEEAMKDTERLVIVAAAGAIRAITGKDLSAKIPLNSKIIAVPPSYIEATDATKKRVILETSKGDIHLRLLEETPLTALNFVRLVKQHGLLKKSFYDGKSFHRIVPNFVAQGGDPRGDGYGGPGYLIRDEVTNRIHDRGTVGIATAGKDTGGCQFFFNLAPNLHLDGKYTLFAEITKGIEVADKLEVGDRIIAAKFAK